MMELQMRLVKVKQSFYDLIRENHVDEEILFNECGRPCILIISNKTPHSQYFPLPPNGKWFRKYII